MSSNRHVRILGVALIAALVYLTTQLPITEWIELSRAWVGSNWLEGALFYIAFVILATILFAPGSLMMMLGGLLFGFSWGVVLAAVAIPLAAQSAFLIGRWMGRDSLRKKIASQPRLVAVEAALERQASLIIVLTRISLILPFNLLNYVYGATSVIAIRHFFATAVGMLPAVVLYVYLGSVAESVAAVVAGDAKPSGLGYWIAAAGVLAIGLASYLVHTAATKALNQHIDENAARGRAASEDQIEK